MAMFNIEPKLAIKIYDVLKQKHPELMKDYPLATSFFNFLNKELKGVDEGEILIMNSKKKKIKETVQKIVREELKNIKSK